MQFQQNYSTEHVMSLKQWQAMEIIIGGVGIEYIGMHIILDRYYDKKR